MEPTRRVAAKRERWMQVADLFAAADFKGSPIVETGAALLEDLRSGAIEARGLRRVKVAHDGQLRENLPRDLYHTRISTAFWREMPAPGDNGEGYINAGTDDDPDEIWSQSDWLAGTFQMADYTSDWLWMLTIYNACRIELSAAEALLARLAGQPIRRRGRPTGPANPKEELPARRGLSLVRSGEAANAHRAAIMVADSDQDAIQHELQVKRLERHISGLLTAPKNSV